ncbi:MAG: leucyl/phenylalanyl-tRNA-protein transferase, partial [Pseudomonadota bacterium]
IEVWQDGDLVGGLYGVYIKPIFFGESMFHNKPDASKAALAFLINKCNELGVRLIDCQQSTPHLKSLGAKEIERDKFLDILKDAYV